METITISGIRMLKITKKDNDNVYYTLHEHPEKVNQQQYNLPKGSKLTYKDGAMMIHHENFCLLRHWNINGQIVDRVAIPWKLLYL